MAQNNSQQFQATFSLNGQQVKDELARIEDRVKAIDKEMEKLSSDGKTQNKERLKQLESERKGLNQQQREMQSLKKVVENAMRDMNNASPRQLKQTMRDINKAIEQGAIKRGTKDWEQAKKVLHQCDAELKKINAEIAASGKGEGLFGSLKNGIGGGIGKIAGMFGVAATGAMAFGKVFTDIIKTNKDFEQANANLASVLGTTRDNITALTDDAKRLGSTTAYTASEVSGLQTELAKLGFNQREILNSTESILNFASATGASLPDAASVAGAALRAFGLDASEMERVVSTMAVATANSALDFSKLQTSMAIVAPVAKQFGFSIEDTTALLGKLSDAGFDASSAATATRNIFLYMADPASKLSKALGGPIKSLDDLAPAFQKLTDRGIDLAEMLDLTDKRAVSAFATLVSQGNSLTELRDKITDCGDALQFMVDERMNTLEGSTKKLSSAWEGLMLTFSNSTGVMKSVVDWATKMIEKLTRLFSTISENVSKDVATGSAVIVKEQKPFWQLQLEKLGIGEASADQLDTYINTFENALDTAEGKAQKIRERISNLEQALKLGIGTKEGKRLSGGLDFYQAHDEIKQLTQDLVAVTVDAERANFFLDKIRKQRDSDNTDNNSNSSNGNKEKGYYGRMKARYDAESKALIATLDKQAMSEEEYENKVYEYKLTALEKTRALYEERTEEYAEQSAKISELATKHQAKLLSIQQKGEKERERENKKSNDKEAKLERDNQKVISKVWQSLRKRQREKETREQSEYVRALESEKVTLEGQLQMITSIYDTMNEVQKRQADVIIEQIRNMLNEINNEIQNAPFDWNTFWNGKKTKSGEKLPGFNDYYNNFKDALGSLSNLFDAEASLEEARVNKKYDALIEAAEKNGKDTAEIEKQKEQELANIQKEAAEKQFAIDMLSATTDMTKSIMKTMSEYAYPWNIAMAALDAAVFGIQIATLKKNYEAQIAGYYSGGYTGYTGNYRREAGVVHEGEFVANHETVNNPEVRPLLDMLDYAQRHNSSARITHQDLAMAAAYRSGGYYGGGYTTPTVNVTPNVTVQNDQSLLARLAATLDRIEKDGVRTDFYASDFDKMKKRQNQLLNNKSRI